MSFISCGLCTLGIKPTLPKRLGGIRSKCLTQTNRDGGGVKACDGRGFVPVISSQTLSLVRLAIVLPTCIA
ncbi:hypothetical protein LZ31DRAFT_552825 [Colletotrichum somersetense]|nr:hypothetical protein LZ31DRAFT_552825 [Colletotrichum somersetense]